MYINRCQWSTTCLFFFWDVPPDNPCPKYGTEPTPESVGCIKATCEDECCAIKTTSSSDIPSNYGYVFYPTLGKSNLLKASLIYVFVVSVLIVRCLLPLSQNSYMLNDYWNMWPINDDPLLPNAFGKLHLRLFVMIISNAKFFW